MDGNWWFKFGTTVVFLLVSLAWLVWTVGGWASPEEVDLHEKREAELLALVDAAEGGEAKVAAETTLADHRSKPLAEAPGWAGFFPTDKISLGLDLNSTLGFTLTFTPSYPPPNVHPSSPSSPPPLPFPCAPGRRDGCTCVENGRARAVPPPFFSLRLLLLPPSP